jgi:hypothetical protein
VKVAIVTADGLIRTASSTNSVTTPKLHLRRCLHSLCKLHPRRKTVYTGTIVFAPPALEKLIATTDNWWAKGPDEKEGMLRLLTRGPDRNVTYSVMLGR